MTSPKKFLFDNSFEPEARAREKAKPQPKYFDEDLARARAEGYAEGQEAGKREALQGLEQSIARSLDTVAQQLPILRQSQDAAWQALNGDVLHAAMAVVKKVLPEMVRREGLAEIEALMRESLERLRDEPRIVVRVADSLLDSVRDRIGIVAAQGGFEGRIVFLADPSLQPGDARIEWADGGVERDTGRLWRDIDAAIQRLVGPPKRSETPEPDANHDPRATRPTELTPEPAAASA